MTNSLRSIHSYCIIIFVHQYFILYCHINNNKNNSVLIHPLNLEREKLICHIKSPSMKPAEIWPRQYELSHFYK